MGRSDYPRLNAVPDRSFFFGVRGTGKSAWARKMLHDGPYVDLLFAFRRSRPACG